MADVTVNMESKNPRELLGQGIRAYVLQDFSSAVQALSKVSELLVEVHKDDLHESLGEVYLYYGKSLLALSREESEALGDAVPKNADEEDDEEDDDEGEEDEENDQNEEKEKSIDNVEKTSENGEKPVENGEKPVENGEKLLENDEKPAEKNGVTESEKPEADQNGTVEKSNEAEKMEAEPSGSGEADQSQADDDEPTDLQVAWEVLELAKTIFQKEGDKGKKNLSEAMITLGEISMESENFESAITDIRDGLELQKTLYGSDNRTIAETLYKLGVAYSTNSQIEDAIKSFNDSLECLKNRINSLEKNEDKKDSMEEEIKEIKSLIPDIEEKIADMRNYKEEEEKEGDKLCDHLDTVILERFECLKVHNNMCCDSC